MNRISMTLMCLTAFTPAVLEAQQALQGFILSDGSHKFRFVMPNKLKGSDKLVADAMMMNAEQFRDYQISMALYNARWCLNGWEIGSVAIVGENKVIEGTCSRDES